MKPRTKWLLAAIFLLLPAFTVLLLQDMETETRTEITDRFGIDAVERHLEFERHKQFLATKLQAGSILTEFTTDGCSGGLSVGWEYLADSIPHFQKVHGNKPAWESCCITHDRAYHSGGPPDGTAETSYEARKNADLALKSCVLATAARRGPDLMKEYGIPETEVQRIYGVIAELMYRSVRIGGVPCTNLPWRWGYGWPECD